METVFGNDPGSRSLPQVVSKDSQPGPDSGPTEPLASTRPKPNLRLSILSRLYAAAKPLQLPEPRRSLMRFFCFAQATHFRDADFLNTDLAKLR